MSKIGEMYNANPQREWNRLARDAYHRLEFIVFMHHLKNHLPAKGLVLDAGGGPGRYTIELAKMGYDVVLLDLSSGCIDTAKQRISEEAVNIQERVRELVVGDVTDLQRFGDEMFDAVICLDPLSCLHEACDRKKAVSELVRVSKPGATVALAVRGYLDVLRTILRIASHNLVDGGLEELQQTGNVSCGGTPHHFFRAEELKVLGESQGLSTVVMAGGEGLSSGLPEATEAIAGDPEKWDRWVNAVIATSTVPAIVDSSGHMLYIGRKEAIGQQTP